MKPMEDAYGQEIYSYFQGKESVEIVERSDGYINFSSGTRMYFSEYKDWDKNEKEAIKYAKDRVLDIGCGAGRHSLYLQKRGLDVLGIDNSPLAVKVSKLRGLKRAKVIPITQINFRPDSFDAILMMGNNFGLFGSFRRAKWLLKKLYRMTSDDAVIIAQANDVYGTTAPEHLEYHKQNRKLGRMSGQLRIRIRFKKFVGKWFDYLLVSKDEMKNILKDTGWEIKKFIDSKSSVYAAIIKKS
jgi:cyclopropane fatty-acyl-phospholipid synthase-like methyltransferase